MRRLTVLFAVLFSALCGVAHAGQWLSAGSGWVWINDHQGSDGVVYNAVWVPGSYGHGGYYSYVPGAQLSPQQLQQIYPPAQASPSPPAQGMPSVPGNGAAPAAGGTYAPTDNWRSELLRQAGKQAEQAQFLDAVNKLGLKGVYGVESPTGEMNLQSLFAQKSGGGGGSPYEQVQQGNTIYGSTDPTYNTFAEPQRIPDFSVAMNGLVSLAAQQQTGSSRLSSELTSTIQTGMDAARLLSETQIRAQMIGQVMGQRAQQDAQLLAALNEIMKANKSQTLQITTQPGGPPSVQVVPTPVGVAVPGGDGGGDAAVVYRDLSLAIATNCLNCHGGEKTSDTSGRLRFGTGKSVDLAGVKDDQWSKVFERVANGSMPPGGKVPDDHKAHFHKAERFLRGGATQPSAQPLPKPMAEKSSEAPPQRVPLAPKP